ncbi:ATP-dependent DNA helicase [Clostridium putrefaciens]|uniref:ATP-dependent DNA helicase n=1 Tax=Clostridium putrefaciens TaxID=99675 RepID=A0A381J9F9_9CLOT|nr:ATP-dependent DNA helicase [Clostridium putrefaciens]
MYEEGIISRAMEDGDKISLKVAGNLREEARFIFNEVTSLVDRTGTLDNICVLSRDNNYNVKLGGEFKRIMSYEAANFEFILVD